MLLRLLPLVVGAAVMTSPVAISPTGQALDIAAAHLPPPQPTPAATGAAPEPVRGVAVDAAAVRVDQALVPGEEYRLPPLRVRNPGTAPTHYGMVLQPGDGGEQPPPEWVRFTPSTFGLGAGETQVVDVAVVVPPGASNGRYTALLVAGIVDDPGGAAGSGARVGAAAATRLEFEVAPASLWAGWINAVRRHLSDAGPWTWVVAGLAAVGGLGWQLSRHFRFRLERVPRP